MPGLPAITCTPLAIPAPPPALRLPHLGLFQKARNGIYSMPSLTTYLCQFQDQIAAAIAPIKMALEILEALLSVKDCLLAVPKAIMELSPDPIYDCFQNLNKAIVTLASYVPPFSWIKTILDIASYAMDLLDELITLFEAVDAKIDQQVRGLAYARTMLNTDLEAVINCNLDELTPLLANTKPLVLFSLLALQPLLEIVNKYTNDPVTSVALTQIKAIYAWVPLAYVALEAGLTLPSPPLGLLTNPPTLPQNPDVPIPPLGSLVAAMVKGRNLAVEIHNVLAPTVGAAKKNTRIVPTFNYL